MSLPAANPPDASDSTGFFQPARNIAHETFEGELVVVNLESGKYYAMRREAADIFRLCLQTVSAEEITRVLAAGNAAENERIATAVGGFLTKLVNEGLIARVSSRAAAPELKPSKEGHHVFAEPEFEVHNDMQDLLMLDPVHEVDTAGWPVMKPESGPR
jgi:coenzyme PQQ synthesis protein D (PqqD)